MPRSREARLLRSRHDKETGLAKRREELTQVPDRWRELFEDLLRRDPDEDLVDRLEHHWLPDIRQGEISNALPDDALFFLKVWTLEALTEERIHAAMESGGELRSLSDRMREIEEEHGVDRGEPWWPGQGPANWEELRREWQQRVDAIFLDTLEAHGETDLAQLFREDPEVFNRKEEKGRRYIFGH